MAVAWQAPDPGFTKINAKGGVVGGILTTAKFASTASGGSTAGGVAKNAPKLLVVC
jgi:hypothetical protein